MRKTLRLSLPFVPLLFLAFQPGVAQAGRLSCNGPTCTFSSIGTGGVSCESISTVGNPAVPLIALSSMAVAGGVKCSATCLALGTGFIRVKDTTGKVADGQTMICSPAACSADAGLVAAESDTTGTNAVCAGSVPEFGVTAVAVASAAFLLLAVGLRISRGSCVRAE